LDGVEYHLDADSFVYELVLGEDGYVVSTSIAMKMGASIPIQGQPMDVVYDMVTEQVYEYEVAPITAPTLTNDWLDLSMTEYFAMTNQTPACGPYNHVDERNHNNICDVCGARMGTPPCILGCSDGTDDLPGKCDLCGNLIAS
jgi:hypothetical protein